MLTISIQGNGRLINPGSMVEVEITGLKQIWNVPLAGYFSYGEFERSEGNQLDFYLSTWSWVALKEK